MGLEQWIESVRELIDAGVENVYLHQVGPDQAGFFAFFRDELRPALEQAGTNEPATA